MMMDVFMEMPSSGLGGDGPAINLSDIVARSIFHKSIIEGGTPPWLMSDADVSKLKTKAISRAREITAPAIERGIKFELYKKYSLKSKWDLVDSLEIMGIKPKLPQTTNDLGEYWAARMDNLFLAKMMNIPETEDYFDRL